MMGRNLPFLECLSLLSTDSITCSRGILTIFWFILVIVLEVAHILFECIAFLGFSGPLGVDTSRWLISDITIVIIGCCLYSERLFGVDLLKTVKLTAERVI
jgi:hypothetical protein